MDSFLDKIGLSRVWAYVRFQINSILSSAQEYTDKKLEAVSTGEIVAKKSEQDASGNNIIATYATKSEAKGYADAKDTAIQEAQSTANEATLAVQQHKTDVDNTLAEAVTAISTLVGEDINKSVRSIANEELAAQLVPASAQESLDTLTEIAAWIQAHPADVSEINAQIIAIKNQLKNFDAGEGVVKTYVDAISTRVSSLEHKLSTYSLILVDTMDGSEHKIQIQSGQLVSFPVSEEA